MNMPAFFFPWALVLAMGPAITVNGNATCPTADEVSTRVAQLVPELVLYNTAKIDAVPASLRNFKGNPTNAGPFWNVHEWELGSPR